MKQNLYVEVHALQDLPPHCLNRDENGSPKTAVYGGALRSYVSSQAWKKAMRGYYAKHIDETKIGYRTLEIVDLINEDLIHNHGKSEKEAKQLTKDLLKNLGLKKGKTAKDENDKTAAIFPISQDEIHAVSEVLLSDPNDGKALKKALKDLPSVDICLFGRMSADDSDLNVDAACQIAPAISVNEAELDTDFFTAVDEIKTTSGAAMMGTKEFTSGVMYRYGNLSVTALEENMQENIPYTISQFIRSFIESMPTGMQNGFAANTLPYAVYVTIRNDRPVSLVSAFESPVLPGETSKNDFNNNEKGYRRAAAARLKNEAESIYKSWAKKPAFEAVVGEAVEGLAPAMNLDDLYSNIEKFLLDNGVH